VAGGQETHLNGAASASTLKVTNSVTTTADTT
jgi:hypothetical protein